MENSAAILSLDLVALATPRDKVRNPRTTMTWVKQKANIFINTELMMTILSGACGKVIKRTAD
jgi:hypothetical protein